MEIISLIRSRGFVLEGFPRNEDETRVLSMSGLFPDAAILLGVEDTDIADRLLPGKLGKWKVKRDKRLAEKAKRKAIALKAKVISPDPNSVIQDAFSFRDEPTCLKIIIDLRFSEFCYTSKFLTRGSRYESH